ncbi:sulfatase-like hydrolase/transferase [Labilibaculum antarcticum]|uniref:Sulfatase n=1 Tax=Labilibaculum antarcticum TaxID=1717717 RepID=A0A1Y1CL35_9BACT|nr:sulfatase-like hydrolase/transferase [Labilibaculum antarcticum]BAX81118.1 sulfatase [Labilibaculum antarcticum]
MKIQKLIVAIFFMLLSIVTIAQQQKPNILWIITDDQRADALACFNEATRGEKASPLGYVESPNIDQFAKEGVLFSNAYCNSPACAPSRASMHTGKYPHHSGIYGFEQNHPNAKYYNLVLPEVLRENGYNTARIGKLGTYIFKWGPGLTWTDPEFYNHVVDIKNNLQRKGFTDYYKEKTRSKGEKETWYYPDGSKKSYYYKVTDGEVSKEDLALNQKTDGEQDILRAYTRFQTRMILGGESTMPGPKTIDGRITEEFQNYFNNANKTYKGLDGRTLKGPKTSEPQFINLGYHFPHSPVLPPKSFRDRFKDKVYNIPDFNRSELEKLPAQLKKLYDKMKVDAMSYDEKQQLIRDYYAFCAFGDSLVGASIKTFKNYCTTNKQEYLILLVCGDHGWHLGEQGISAKFGPYDKSNHSTVIAVSSDKKKFPAGKIVDEYVEFVDFAPTFYASAGLDVNAKEYDYLDGYDLAEVVNGNKIPRDYVLGEMNHVIGDRAYIRTKDFAFSMRVREKDAKPKAKTLNVDIKWALTSSSENAEMALYDLRVDTGEQSNVAYAKNYEKLAEWFRNKLGNIVLGDGRIECDWSFEDKWTRSDFAVGADNKKIDIPNKIIPNID